MELATFSFYATPKRVYLFRRLRIFLKASIKGWSFDFVENNLDEGETHLAYLFQLEVLQVAFIILALKYFLSDV